jgi:hypothetical protein
MKVDIFITTPANNKLLDGNRTMSGALLKTLDDALRFEPENQSFRFIKEQVDKENDKEAWFHEVFPQHITLIHDFAKKLHRYDSLWPGCLLPKTKFGKALIELLDYGEYRLVLTGRIWRTTDVLSLDFELVLAGHYYN